MTKLPQNIKPFSIKNDKKLCGMSSALQCLLSLPNFLISLNLPKNVEILEIFRSLVQGPHDLEKMQNFIKQKNKNVDFQDSFAFIDSFIDIMTKNKELDTRNLFLGDMSKIHVCPDCEFQKEIKVDEKFSSIELSFKKSLRIIYVPYNLEETPILTSTTSLEDKKNLVYIRPEKFEIIKNVLQFHYDPIYAFELPEYNRDKIIIICQLNCEDNSMSAPLLCEIPKDDEKQMKDVISKRIRSLFKPKNFSIQIQNKIFKTIEFSGYRFYSEFIQVKVFGRALKDRKPVVDDDLSLKLNDMFDGYTCLSKPRKENAFFCEFCKKQKIPYIRKRLTKLPQILIFRIKRTEEHNSYSTPIKIPAFICLNTSEFNEFHDIKNPYDYKAFENNIYELRATSNHFVTGRNLKTFSYVKRENEWYKILDDKCTQQDDSPKESNNADLLFYEIIDHDGAKYEDNTSPSRKSTKKKIICTNNGDKEHFLLDPSELANATDVIKFFRKKYNNNKIIGFKTKEKSYYEDDKTSFNDIFPPEKRSVLPVEILFDDDAIEKKPPSSYINQQHERETKQLEQITQSKESKTKNSASGKNLSYALIDNSSSMIACFKDSGVRRSKVAVNSINRFLRNGSLYCNSDVFLYGGINMAKVSQEVKYDENNFKDRSELQSNLDFVTAKIIKQGDFQNKRILLISDGIFIPYEEEEEHKESLMDVYKNIINNKIILDVILLKNDTNIAKELCAVSHLSGGYYFCPESLDDLYEFLDEEKFINFQKRNIYLHNYADENIIKNRTEFIFTAKNLDSYKKHNLRQEMILASPFYKYTTNDDNIIEKEIDKCAAAQNSKKQFFSIYRLSDRDGGFLKRRAIVFLKSIKGPLLLFEIFFPLSYPDEEPFFKLASDVKMDKIPNYMFNVLENEYTKETELIYLIKKLNKRLQSEEVEDNFDSFDKNNFDSFDKIEGVYYTQYGEEKKFDD